MNEFTYEIIAAAGLAQPIEQRGGMDGIVEQFRRAGGYFSGERSRPHRSYGQVSAVYACVKARADALSMMPLRISTGDEQLVETGPMVDLVERPNPKMTGRALRRATEALLLLFGRVHWVFTLAPGGLPVEVYVINPMQMMPNVDQRTGDLVGWRFRPAGIKGAQLVDLSVEEVHTIIDPDFEDPNCPFEGVSPRRAASLAISQFFKADLANESSLDNGIEPGAIFTIPGNPLDDQIKDMREQLRDAHSGVMNRNRHLLLHGGMDVKTISRAFKEMEFRDLKAMSRTDICVAFGVLPAVIGYYEESNFAHAESAEKSFWIKTILPRAAWIAEEWDLGVLSKFKYDRSVLLASARTRKLDVAHQRTRAFVQARDASRSAGRQFYSWFDSSSVPEL